MVGVGEIGYDDITPEEDRFLALQLELARQFDLPVLVHTPHRDKIGGTKRTLAVIREVGIAEDRVLIDHLNELTLPLVLDSGCWRGHSIYPNTKMSEQRMVALLQQYGTERMVVNSAADWGVSDPLKVPKTADAMRQAGFSEAQVEQVLFHNPVDFFAQSGQLDKAAVATLLPIDQRRKWQDNSALRARNRWCDEPGNGMDPPRLGYCGNVHPAHDLAALRASIAGPFQAVRRQRGLPYQDSGLWISARAAAELQQPGPRAAFLALLKDSGLRLTSLNGFPMGASMAAT